MKNLIVMFILLFSSNLFCQSLYIFDTDISNFPTIKAKYFAFDKDGNQILNLNPSDFEVLENGQERHISYVSCPPPQPPVALSSVLVFDVSGSMSAGPPRIQSAKDAANAWINGLPLGKSECALVSFDDRSSVVQDFTTSRDKLVSAVEKLSPAGGTDYNQALIDLPAGGLQIAKDGRYKRVVIFLTDGLSNSPRVNEIIQFAKHHQITIFAVTLDMPAPQSIKDITLQTGGQYFENITTLKEAEETYRKLLQAAQGGDHCEIEWQSGPSCIDGFTQVELRIPSLNLITKINYQNPSPSIAKLEFNPTFFSFKNPPIGTKVEQKITVTARNSDFNVANIILNNNKYSISPNNFILKNGESRELTVSYTATDRSYTFCKLDFQTDVCPVSYYASAGYIGVPATQKTLEITKPIAGDVFLVGIDTIITWTGIPESDTVSLEYSIDNGNTWTLITDSATGLKYNWNNIPKPQSDECIIRAKQGKTNNNVGERGSMQFDLKDHTSAVLHISWSPDGSRVATASGDKTGIIWDAATGKKLHTLSGHSAGVLHISWSPDGRRVATSSFDKTGIIWDAATGKKLHTLSGHSYEVPNISWSPDGSRVVTSSYDKTGIIWDAVSGEKLHTLSGHNSRVNHITWNPDGSRVATSSFDNTGIIWDAVTGEKLHTLGHTNRVNHISWSPNGSRVATASDDHTGIIWDAVSGEKLHTLSGHTNSIYHISWSPDGSRVATASNDYTGIIWEASAGDKLHTLSGHTNRVTHIYWSPDGSRVATASDDKTGLIWDASTGEKLHTLSGYSAQVLHISWSPDGNGIATASFDKTCTIWDALTGEKLHALGGHTDDVNHISWSPDGSRVATASDDKTGIIWDAMTGKNLHTLNGHIREIYHISWSPDGSSVATASRDNTGIIWDAATGKKLHTLSGHSGAVLHISWSPDGSRVATANDNKTGIIWDASTGEKLHTLSGHTYMVRHISWSPDGSRVATASYDDTGIIWDASTGEKLHTLSGHTHRVRHISWSPDGSRVATSSHDNTGIIWDASTGEKLHTLSGHTLEIYNISWSPDGGRVATAGFDYTGILWDAVTGEKLHTLRHNNRVTHISWSPDGGRVAAAGDYGICILWDAVTGEKLFTLIGHSYGVSNISWSPDGSRVATASDDLTAKIWIIDNSDTVIQEAESEIFSIVESRASSHNVDMLQCLVGSVKDSLVAGFVSNIGSWKFRVDDIYIQGADASAFSLVSGLPVYSVEAGQSQHAEFRFTPTEARIYQAEIVIVTQAETLIRTIRGEGVEPQLEIYSGVLDFGEVEIGNESTIRDTVLLKNISGSPITITNTVKMYPDIEQFEILAGGGSFVLPAYSERKLTLQFKPIYGGRTSGRIGFEHNGIGSPATATVQLFGTGIGGVVAIPYDSGYAGDRISMPLVLEKIKPEGIQAMASRFSAMVKFHGRILYPQNQSLIHGFSNDSITVKLEGNIPNSNIWTHLPLVVGLGNVEETDIEISDVKLYDNFGNDINYDIEYLYGNFRLLGICREGGARLINPSAKAGIINATPNPANSFIDVEISLTEKGATELCLYNSIGLKEVVILDSDNSPQGVSSYRIDTSRLSTGQYFLQLRTPTHIENKIIILVK